MLLTAYPSCGEHLADPTGDVTDDMAAALSTVILDHLGRCPGCRVRVTLWGKCGRVVTEHTFTDEWVPDAGASRHR
jgi:ribosomal protein S27E